MSNILQFPSRPIPNPGTPKLKLRAANLVMLRSLDPDALPHQWEPIRPEDVPQFLKAPETIAQLVNGAMAQKEEQDGDGKLIDPYWYRAEEIVLGESDVRSVLDGNA